MWHKLCVDCDFGALSSERLHINSFVWELRALACRRCVAWCSDRKSRNKLEGKGCMYRRDFPRSYRPLPAGPTLLAPTPAETLRPDLIWTRFWPDFDLESGPEICLFRSESGRNQIKIRSESGPGRGVQRGRCQSGRSGWGGPCRSSGISKSLTLYRYQLTTSGSIGLEADGMTIVACSRIRNTSCPNP